MRESLSESLKTAEEGVNTCGAGCRSHVLDTAFWDRDLHHSDVCASPDLREGPHLGPAEGLGERGVVVVPAELQRAPPEEGHLEKHGERVNKTFFDAIQSVKDTSGHYKKCLRHFFDIFDTIKSDGP